MKNDTDTAALLPCPFCGGGAAYDFDNTMVAPYGHMLTCNRCATTSGSSPSKEHAIAAWNRRTTTPPTDRKHIELLAHQNTLLWQAVHILETALRAVGDDYPGSSCQKWCRDELKKARATYTVTGAA